MLQVGATGIDRWIDRAQIYRSILAIYFFDSFLLPFV
jgi:hypothetical protein